MSQIKGKVALISLGCPKNVVDAENMLGSLVGSGYALCENPADADIIMVNTCSFIGPAREESFGAIQEMARFKGEEGNCKGLVVSGCLAQRYSEDVKKQCPDVDAMIGVSHLQDVNSVFDELIAKKRKEKKRKIPRIEVSDPNDLVHKYYGRLRFGPKHYAYLKISEGCNQKCGFCDIPNIRGKLMSRSIEDVTAETRDLVSDGAREIIIISQDTTSYGLDMYGRRRIVDLVREVAKVDGLDWLRILYHYPAHYPEGLLEEIAANDRILNYIDIPLQHSSDNMLKAMRRGIRRQATEDLLGKIRQTVPNAVIRSTFIVGYPGETEADFEDLCEFIRGHRFDRLGVFTYSFEKHTYSSTLPNQIPEEVKQERRNRLMEIQQEITFEKAGDRIGQTLKVIVDGLDAESGRFAGRSYADAPEIDTLIFIKDKKDNKLVPGEFYDVKVTGREGYDLLGEVVKSKSLVGKKKKAGV